MNYYDKLTNSCYQNLYENFDKKVKQEFENPHTVIIENNRLSR